MPYYDPNDYDKFVDGMKIIPLQTSELKSIVSKILNTEICIAYLIKAYKSELKPHEWYAECILNIL